jgi:hypothetical protein
MIRFNSKTTLVILLLLAIEMSLAMNAFAGIGSTPSGPLW